MFYSVEVDLRHRQVSKTVEEVQKIVKDLTFEVSVKDGRFQSISNSGIHSDSLKVRIHPEETTSLRVCALVCPWVEVNDFILRSLGSTCFARQMGHIAQGTVCVQSSYPGNIQCPGEYTQPQMQLNLRRTER